MQISGHHELGTTSARVFAWKIVPNPKLPVNGCAM